MCGRFCIFRFKPKQGDQKYAELKIGPHRSNYHPKLSKSVPKTKFNYFS